jgi:hypothetical protein
MGSLCEVGNMITSVKNKFIFIHTSKTGGASIQKKYESSGRTSCPAW